MTEYQQGYQQGLRDALEAARNTAWYSGVNMQQRVVDTLTTLLTSFIAKFKKN